MFELNQIDRRSFLKQFSSAVVLLPAIAGPTLVGCKRQSAFAADDTVNLSWKTTLVSDKELGDPLIISGTIYGVDGKTPAESAVLWVYQTDATGKYSPSPDGNHRYTKIHGQMKTGPDGRYEFRTIKPMPYPGNTVPAHIHASLSAPGFQEYWIDNYLFEGDPFITEQVRKQSHGEGSFASILTLTRGSDGVLRGRRDIQLERCAERCVKH
jgi:protocatechuate 3,4-dioxygenase beta subunit